jgi:NAD-dependent dihydropyrimidine dehydrogenase PreA subunit
MKREIIKIDEEKCNGCGLCIPNCHEGALQIIDGKARLVSDLMCDGLGACIGHCPEGALEIEEREAAPYDEVKVIIDMIPKGKNTIIAHLKHLKDHQEFTFLKEAVTYLKENESTLPFQLSDVIMEVHHYSPGGSKHVQPQGIKMAGQPLMQQSGGGCPGSAAASFKRDTSENGSASVNQASELSQWPVQMHLINPASGLFSGTDFVLAADCVAFSLGNFHSKFLKGKTLGIACPKLDSNKDIYLQKLTSLIDQAQINTMQVMIMEVPCCGGLLQMAKQAVNEAGRKIPLKAVTVGIKGDILLEEWV